MDISYLRSSVALAVFVMAAATFAPTGAQAQSAPAATPTPDQGDGVGDIVVTAQKRDERLLDVPISISVVGGAALDKSTGQGVGDVLASVAGVSISAPANAGSPIISVRGVAASYSTFSGSSPIGYYLDSVPFGFVRTAIQPDAGTFDLDRIEVLRGPQGTLYGANAQNGVVRILTKDANVDRVEFKARAMGSRTQFGGGNYGGDAAINVPIIDGKLAIRAVGGYSNFSGWIDRAAKSDINSSDNHYFRFKINATPTERLSLGASVWLSRRHSDAPDAANNLRLHPALVDEPTDVDYNIYALKASYDFDGFTATSATSYIDFAQSSIRDSSLQGLADNILISQNNAQTFSQEINLASTGQGNWRWTLGGIYRDGSDQLYQIRKNYAMTTLRSPYLAPADVIFTSKSIAAFGEITRKLFDGKIELTAGLRYFKDKVGLNERSRLSGAAPALLINRSNNYDAFTPRGVITWFPAKNLTVYTSYSEGFRSGADQLPTVIFAAPAIPAVRPDRLKNYEVGIKGKILDGLITFDTAAYFIKWLDVQQPLAVFITPQNTQAALVNGVSASGAGFDFSTSIRPARGLTLDLNFSVNDLKQDAQVISGVTVLFEKGERLNFSPKYTAGGGISYTLPLGNTGLDGKFNLSGTYTSERKYQLLRGTTVLRGIGDKTFVAGGRFTLQSKAGWTASLFVENLTNEQGKIFQLLSTPNGFDDPRLRPRTIGLQLDYSL